MSSSGKAAVQQYLDGDYESKNPDWHLADSPNKAADLHDALTAMLQDSPQQQWRIADIGAGAGGVLQETMKRMIDIRPNVAVKGCGIEISSQAVAIAAQKFPDLEMRQKFFQPSDGPFDAVMFVDVLEHLENPWQILRDARTASKYMLVRQPLLENFSTFRHKNYRPQRDAWGHIGFFTYHFFLDMAKATGWEPLKIDLKPPWELAGNPGRGGLLQRLLIKANRELASFIISGFYLNGVFKAR
jgi:hypothetical protein